MNYYQLLLEADAKAYLDKIKAGQIKAIDPKTFFSHYADENLNGRYVLEHVIDVVKARADWQLQLARFLKQYNSMEKIAKLRDGNNFTYDLERFFSEMENNEESDEDFEEIFKNKYVKIIHPNNYKTAKKYGSTGSFFLTQKEAYTNFVHSKEGGGKLYYIWISNGSEKESVFNKPIYYINGYQFSKDGKQKRVDFSYTPEHPDLSKDPSNQGLEILLDPYYGVPKNVIADLFGKHAAANYMKLRNSGRANKKAEIVPQYGNKSVKKIIFRTVMQAETIIDKNSEEGWKQTKIDILDIVKQVVANANKQKDFKMTDLINKKYKNEEPAFELIYSMNHKGETRNVSVIEKGNPANKESINIEPNDTTSSAFSHVHVQDKKAAKVASKYPFMINDLAFSAFTKIKNEYRNKEFYVFEQGEEGLSSTYIFIVPNDDVEASTLDDGMKISHITLEVNGIFIYPANRSTREISMSINKFRLTFPYYYRKIKEIPLIKQFKSLMAATPDKDDRDLKPSPTNTTKYSYRAYVRSLKEEILKKIRIIERG